MNKQNFKKHVLKWLAKNGIKTDKKMRVYKYRGDWELRIYNEPMEMTNTRKSRRKLKDPTDEFNCTYGIHSTKISTYTHINERDLNNKDEMNFILQVLKDNLIYEKHKV